MSPAYGFRRPLLPDSDQYAPMGREFAVVWSTRSDSVDMQNALRLRKGMFYSKREARYHVRRVQACQNCPFARPEHGHGGKGKNVIAIGLSHGQI